MPTYEYACKDCGHQFDVVQSFSDDALTVCPSCEGRLRKVFSAAGIIFKGSGWHIKDYATSSASGSPSAGGEGTSSSSDSSGDTSSGGSSSAGSSSSKESTSSQESGTTTSSRGTSSAGPSSGSDTAKSA